MYDIEDYYSDGTIPRERARFSRETPTEGKASRETKKKRGKITDYSATKRVSKADMEYIRIQLMNLYRGVSDGIADDIAIRNGSKVYVVDSGRVNGRLDFAVKKIRNLTIPATREEFIRSTNNDARSKGNVSAELLENFGDGSIGYFGSNLRRELGGELQTDKGKSQNQQGGVPQKNAEDRGLNTEGKASREIDSGYSTPEEAKESGKVSDAKFSLEFAPKIAENQRKTVENGTSMKTKEQ